MLHLCKKEEEIKKYICSNKKYIHTCKKKHRKNEYEYEMRESISYRRWVKKGDGNNTEGKGDDSSQSILFRTALTFGNCMVYTHTYTLNKNWRKL